MITFTPEFRSIDYKQLYSPGVTFIYRLEDDGQPFYVGSTKNPTARYFGHLNGDTKNTNKRVTEMKTAGRVLTLRIIDATTSEHRDELEAAWIAKSEWAINENRMATALARYDPANPPSLLRQCLSSLSIDNH